MLRVQCRFSQKTWYATMAAAGSSPRKVTANQKLTDLLEILMAVKMEMEAPIATIR